MAKAEFKGVPQNIGPYSREFCHEVLLACSQQCGVQSVLFLDARREPENVIWLRCQELNNEAGI